MIKFKEQIEAGQMDETYIPKQSQNAIMELYEYANKKEISLTDRRTQQLVYHINLIKEQKNLGLILFGNGFLINYPELTLEMEIPAFLFNFGIIGFLLYFAPFLSLFIYAIWRGIKNLKCIDIEYLMLLFGCFLSFVLSFLAGYTYFNSSSMMIIIVLNLLLYSKVKKFY